MLQLYHNLKYVIVQGMLGDLDEAMKTIHNFHQVWRQFGFTPEYYNIPKAEVHQGREGYPLRPGMDNHTFFLCLP